jgi:serine/threonine-protein kinase
MATVYLAEDLKHHRKVAIKVLRPELAAALGPDRFLREIQLAARLHHPHILPLYDSGEAGGLLYYVMPFVEGESLRDRLARERQLPLEGALQVTREVADALDYAHNRDVVHRDIKPENILLEWGHALVSDFGIARAINAAGSDKVTETGLVVGTPAYMSPEQASGERTLSGCSDVYSLGCVLYEMLAGEPPYTGPTAQAILARRLTDPVPPLRTVRENVPVAVERAIGKALAKVPADRFGTAKEFAEALERTSATAAPEQSIAVLPFSNMSADPDTEYFSDGITEEIINVLAGLEGLRVAARTSSFSFKSKTPDLAEVGAKLHVRTVLEGGVRCAGNRLRVTVQLINVADGFQLWS